MLDHSKSPRKSFVRAVLFPRIHFLLLFFLVEIPFVLGVSVRDHHHGSTTQVASAQQRRENITLCVLNIIRNHDASSLYDFFPLIFSFDVSPIFILVVKSLLHCWIVLPLSAARLHFENTEPADTSISFKSILSDMKCCCLPSRWHCCFKTTLHPLIRAQSLGDLSEMPPVVSRPLVGIAASNLLSIR